MAAQAAVHWLSEILAAAQEAPQLKDTTSKT